MQILHTVFFTRWPVAVYLFVYVVSISFFLSRRWFVLVGIVLLFALFTFAPYILGAVPWR